MKLPNTWSATTLADCQTKTRSLDPRLFPYEEFDLFSVPSYSDYRPDVVLGRDIGSTKQEVQKGDVLLCKIVPHIRRSWVVPTAGDRRQIASGEWIVFRDHGIEPEYLRRFLLSDDFHRQFMRTVSGVGGSLLRARPAEAGKIEVPIPPLLEQRRIVVKLDGLTARLARARAELDRVLVLAQRYRSQTIRAALAPGVGTPMRRIDTLCKVGTGSTPKRGERRYYDGGTIPWITSGAVNAGVVTEPTELITAAAIKETNCKIFPAGSLLVALYGEGKTRGKVATLGINAATNQALAVLHLFDYELIEPDWIKLFLQGRYDQTRAEAAGGVQPNLNLGIVKAIQVPTPPLTLQRRAISQLTAVFGRADRLEAEAARARALLGRLESTIVTRAFRGELVPQDPKDEPASRLLARIRAERDAAPTPRPLRQLRTPVAVTALSSPTTTKGVRMTKSRQDEDVMDKPYLAKKLKHMRGGSAQELFRLADLPVADFYKQLAWEIDNNHIIDSGEVLSAA